MKIKSAYTSLYAENTGVFYIVAGILDNNGLIEHGTAIRYSWLTAEGEKILRTIQTVGSEGIECAEGTAYDGVYYKARS